MSVPATQHDIVEMTQRQLPHARVRMQQTQWGWVVEVIDERFGAPPDSTYDTVSRLFRAIDSLLASRGETVWKLCTARDELAAFNVNATLRTIPSGPDENGTWTSTLTVADTYLEITEYDAELLYANATTSLQAIETTTAAKTPLLPYKPAPVRYRTLEVGGHAYLVSRTSVQDNFSPRRINVEIRS